LINVAQPKIIFFLIKIDNFRHISLSFGAVNMGLLAQSLLIWELTIFGAVIVDSFIIFGAAMIDSFWHSYYFWRSSGLFAGYRIFNCATWCAWPARGSFKWASKKNLKNLIKKIHQMVVIVNPQGRSAPLAVVFGCICKSLFVLWLRPGRFFPFLAFLWFFCRAHNFWRSSVLFAQYRIFNCVAWCA
jgi:hypothetical protein